MSYLFGPINVSEPSIDEVGLSILFDLENRPDEPLNHGFVIDEAFPAFVLGLVEARLDVGFIVGVAWLHSKITNISYQFQSDLTKGRVGPCQR